MLTELRISNFALIDHLRLEFTSGFHVLTGETGAGKSILVDAIALLVGGRASADQIRSDADEAVLEASFSLPTSSSLTDRFREGGLLGQDETEIVVRRTLSRGGRSRVYVNGNLTPLHVLQVLAGTLIDIHGQHDQQSLLSAPLQLEVLDSFGRLQDLRRDYLDRYEQWCAHRWEMEEAVRLVEERQAREDSVRFQHRELAEAELQPGEEDALALERRRLSQTEQLSELSEEAYERLYGAESSVLSELGRVSDCLRKLATIEPDAAEWGTLCESGTVQLRELARRLRDYSLALRHDPGRLAQVEERLGLIQRLKKKYGLDIDGLLARMQELEQDIERMAKSETRVAELRELVAAGRARAEGTAGRLSEGRARAAQKMEARVKEELASLHMEQTRFKIAVSSDGDPTAMGPTGRDRVEYLLSANQGEPLQPLGRVASGGELSRVMLALKTVLAETDRVPVLIFDEVDAGIGGAVASVMGRRLRGLAEYHQVFCITHLPQIASQAETHVLVEKAVEKKRTVTTARRLDQAGRREEIARMLGGLAITKAVRQTAAEMLEETEPGR